MKDVRLAFAERLIEICADKGLKAHGRQAALARQMKISQPAAKKWFDGDAMPDTDKIVEIALWGNVSFEWLMTGRGPKRLGEDSPLLTRYQQADAATRTLIDIALTHPDDPLPEGLSPSLRTLVAMARTAIANDIENNGHP